MKIAKTCALRAPTVFLVRIKTIRTKNTVMDKSNNGLGLFLYKIADCVRTAFRPCAIGDPRGRVFRPRNIATLQQRGTRFKSPQLGVCSRMTETDSGLEEYEGLHSLILQPLL
jgi:hypothetical protein